MPAPDRNNPIIREMLAEQAYGPITSASYGEAAKSARANELGRSLGLSPDLIESSLPDMMREDVTRKRVEDARRNATYAKIMSNRRLAAAAIDDDHLPKVADKVNDQISIFSPAYIGMAATHFVGGLVDAIGQTANYLQGVGEGASATRQQMKKGPLGFLANLPDPVEALGPIGKSLAVLPNMIADNTNPSTGNPWKDTGLSAFRSTGTSVSALAAGMLTSSPSLALGMVAGATGGQTYRQDRMQGIDANTALTHATADAEIEGLTEALPTGFLMKNVGKGVGKLILGDIAREVPGEFMATLGQSFDQWYYVDRPKGQSFKDYAHTLPEQEAQTVLATVLTAGMLGPSLHVINRQIERGVSAKAAQHVDKIMEAAAQSPTRTANPSDFAMALSQVLEDTPAEHLYVPAEAIAKLFQGEEGKAAPSITEDPFWHKYADEVQNAAALGQDVVIPLSDAATHLAGTPQWEALKDHVRVSPKGLSIAEAKDQAKEQDLDAIAGRMSEMVNEAVPRMQQVQALHAVKDFASGLGYQGDQADAISHYVASALYTTYRGEMEKRVAAGEQPVPVGRFAQEWLPHVSRQAQAQYEKTTNTFEQNRGATIPATMREFAAQHGVRLELQPVDNFMTANPTEYPVTALEVTDLYADEPGKGSGTKVMQRLTEMADQAGINLVLRPEQPRNNEFYSRFGFEGHPTKRGFMLRYSADGEDYEQGSPTSAGGDNAAAGSVRDAGGLRGSPRLLAAAPGSELGLDQPLAGAPTSLNVPGRGKVAVTPHVPAREAAREYMRQAGLSYQPATRYAKVDAERAARIADEFDKLKHNPKDPEVAAAYAAMARETIAQLRSILATGLHIEFIKEGQQDPYEPSPRLAILDVHENSHLWVFPTQGGFGQGEISDDGHPMLEPTEFVIDGHHLVLNDVFRIVHDYFGHIKDGHGFRAEGEENAWQSHAAMYTPLARRAMTTETRGQNSWVNYGPKGDANRTASSAVTQFAPQKVALMPDWTSSEGLLAGEQSGTEQTYDQAVEARPIFSQPYDLGRYGDGQELTRPPVGEDGQVQLEHFSQAEDLTRTDPERWGQGKAFYSREERVYMRDAPPRTYFGIATNQPGGYKLEFVGRTPYKTKLPLDRLYDAVANPAELWTRGQYADSEHAIKNAGFAGYWVKHPELGLVAVVFEPVEVEGVDPHPLTLDQAVEPTGWERTSQFLTGEEKDKMREAAKAKLLDIIDALPPAKEMAAVAYAGRAKKGWYYRSAQAIVDVFGIEDAPRFAALLAALSPQTAVEQNFYNAIKIWTGWNNAGRPTDRAEIVRVMGENVQGSKGSGSVLTAWINNSFAALTDANPATLKLSGPKVNSFFANLVGVTDEVTNDTWMARWAGLDAMATGGKADKDNLYKAMNAVVREAAAIVSERTGEDWTPSEVQETVWSFAKTLYEMREQAGETRTMRELLEAGGITHQDIARTPDFAVLFTDGVFRRILEEGGYGRAVEDLAGTGRNVHVNGDESAVASSQGSGFAEDAYRTLLAATADRLEAVRDRRRANAEERRRDTRQLGLTLNQDVTPSEAVFYSNATRVVEQAKQDKASPEQWAALLTPGRTPGIKAEEIEWTGILDWLKMQKGQIDKAALLQVLRDRGISVEEVVLGGPGETEVFIPATGERFVENEGEEAVDPKFQSWSSDPSNDSYRELLITLPLGEGSNPERGPSTHWDQEGVVAHVRFMEKADAEGKRVLFIEEVQSDWHQKGRDQGYATPASKEEIAAAEAEFWNKNREYVAARRTLIDLAIELGLMSARPEMNDDQKEGMAASKIHGFIQSSADEGDNAEAIYKAYRAAQLAKSEANQFREIVKGGRGIPDAPFKSSWPALVMKRAIRWAVDHGYDKVAWTTGEEQASRYNLSSAVGSLTNQGMWDSDGYAIRFASSDAAHRLAQNGLGEIKEHSPRDTTLRMTEKQMREAFGNDITQRLLDSDGETISGEGLRVGGEGMKAFYDRNLVNITNDIIKKYGVKVGPIGIPVRGATEDNKSIYQNFDGTWGYHNALGDPHTGLASKEEAQAALDADRSEIATHAGFEITPQLATAAAGGFPLFQQKRGNITIQPGDNGLMQSAIIRAFEASNFSTAVHELGHFFLEDLKRRALTSTSTTQERADWQTFKDWAVSLGHAVDDHAPIPVAAHEYFARGMERFVWEGKAPSLALRAVFTRMREFMLSLYRTATAFNAPITPEIRDVMGRMLASQEEIDAQRAELGLVSKAIKGLLSETEQKTYDDLAEEARQGARDQLFERVLSTLRQQKKGEVREQTDAIRAEAEGQVSAQPIYRALKLLRVGQPLPGGTFAKVKLDRQWLTDTYGPEIEQQLPKGVPPIVSDKDTMDADMLAGLAGFNSGDALVKALIEHEGQRQSDKAEGEKRSPRQKAVDEIVEQRAKEEIGDPFEHLEEEAQDAIASNRQADLLAMEARALARKTGQKPTPWKLAKEWAQKRIALQSAREAISGRAIQSYARAVTKAGREYEEALIAGDFEEAFRAKQRQLLNMALMSEAKKAANDVDAAVRRMQKLAKRETIPSVDQDYLEQAHILLADVDLKSNYRQSDRASAFAEWHAKQVAMGVLPVVPPGYRELLGRTHWSKLSVPELLELDKAVGQIVELGRLKQKLRDGLAQRDFDEAIAELVGSAEEQKARKDAKSLGERTLPERARSILRSADAAMLKMEQLAKWLDGDALHGPWQRLVFRIMSEAQGRQDDLTRSYVSEINAIIKALPKTLVKRWADKVDTPELVNDRVPALAKDQVVMMAMNWGNEGNRQRLLDGYGWEEASVLQVFDRLMTKEDWDFVQQVWDVVDKLWPEVAALERRVNGLAPEKVEAVPVTTRHGIYRGGYFPVIYDAAMSSRAAIDEDNKLSPEGGFMQVTTRAGATKARAEAVKDRPVLLSMGVITRHLGEVIHDVTHREAVMQVKKILGDKRIGDAVRERLGPEYLKAMGSWLENIARPGTMYSKSNAALVRTGRYLNKATAMVGLGFRFSTTVMQLLGIPIVAAEVGEAHLTKAMGIVIAHPVKSWNEMQARSAEMRARADNLDATIEDMVHQATSGKLQEIGPKGLQKYAMRGIAYMDMLVSTTAWTAGFNKALSQGLGEDEAVHYADQVVRTTQGSGGGKDRSGIMNEHPLVRSFYAFFSYLNALFNMQRDVFRTAGEGHYLEAAHKAWWVMICPMLLQAAIFGQGPDGGDDDEVDVADWAKYLLTQLAIGNMGSLPLVGTLASAIGNGYTYRSSAYNAMGEGLLRMSTDAKKVYAGDKEVDGSTVKATITTVGLFTAMPTGQIGATTGGVVDYATGKADPQTAGDWYNLLTKGYIPDAAH